MLSGQHVGDALRVPANECIKAAAHFVAGDIQLEPDQLVDQLAALLDQLTDPNLYGFKETAAGATAASRD